MSTTILLYGRTGAGKSAQVGVLAEHVFKTTGKRTRMYTADRGGVDTIQPYLDLKLIDVVEIGNSDPWMFLNKSTHGFVRDAAGKWVLDKARNAEVGFYAFESLRSMASALMFKMAQDGARGVNIGGGSNVSFSVTGDGETLKISGNNPAHYGAAQSRILEEVLASQHLDAQYIMWTSGVSKEDDNVSTSKMLGPDVVGKALTPVISMEFNYTMRIDVFPATREKPERHLLYLGSHTDVNAGNAAAVGNIRRPLDAPPLKETIIEPANIVQALTLLRDEGTKAAAVAAIKARLGMK